MAMLSTGNLLEQQQDRGVVGSEKYCQAKSPTEVDPLKLLESLSTLDFLKSLPLESGEQKLDLLDGLDSSYLGGISPQCSPSSEYSAGSDSGYAGSTATSPGTSSPFSRQKILVSGEVSVVPPDKEDRSASLSKVTLLEKNRKNAIAARQNRIKKKKYVVDLEEECSQLKTENVILKTKCHEFQTKASKLQAEVQYLKSVLANDSVLASLISNIPKAPEVKLTSSFRKRSRECSDSENTKKQKIQASNGGICLHVTKDVVSLEFCSDCSKQASS